MRIENLKIFVDLGRCRSFSQTAQMNDISQSAVSQFVNHLEKKLDLALVDRSTRPLQLTTAGKTYFEGCKNLLEQYQNLEASIRNEHASVAGILQVAAIYSIGLLNMKQYCEQFSAEHPGAEVHLEYLHPNQVYEKVIEGSADLGLISFAQKSRQLSVIPWRDEEMVLVCSPRHEFAKLSSISPAQLQGEKYIGFTKELAIRQKVDRFLRQHNVTVEVILEFDNTEFVKRAIEIGNGIALLPKPMATHEVGLGTLVVIPLVGCRLTRPLSIIYRGHQKLSPSAALFIKLIRQQGEGAEVDNTKDAEAATAANPQPQSDVQESP